MSEHTGNDPGQWPPPGHAQQPQQPQQPGQWDATQQVSPPVAGQWGQAPPTGVAGQAPDPFAGGQPAVEQSSVRSGLPLGRLGLIATVIVLAGLGGFAVWRALAAPGGAATPEEAAAQVFEAADAEDLLGIVEAMLPSEREAMVQPITDVMIELARLDVLAEDAVQGDEVNTDVSGLSFDIPAEGEPGALVYDVEPLGSSEDIRWVTVTDGELTVTFDPQQARELLGDRLGRMVEDLDPAAESQTETVDLGEEYERGEPVQFAVVEEDGSWYFSLWYTVAGLATDGQAPDLALAATPVGADSAEAAASEFLESLIELELTGAMSLLDPEEFRAAYDYWGEFGPEVAAEAASVRQDASAEGFSWDVLSIGAGSENRNGRTVATINELTVGFTSTAVGSEADLTVGIGEDGLTIDGTIQGQAVQAAIDGERATGQGTIDGQQFEFDLDLVTYDGFAQVGIDRFDMTRQGDCLLVTINNTDTEEVCGDDFGAGGDPFASLELQQEYQDTFSEIGSPGLTVVERDGRWYVSGFPTYAYTIVDFLKVVDPEEFDELLDSYEELLDGLDDFDL